jgi:hypothetical protein
MPVDLDNLFGGSLGTGQPLAAIKAMLRKYPQARSEGSTTHLTVLPPDANGFRVTFREQAAGFVVECDGWHQDFADAAKALDCFAIALSPASRLKLSRRGTLDCAWQLEIYNGTEWVGLTEVALPTYPLWRPVKIVHLQNRLLEAA